MQINETLENIDGLDFNESNSRSQDSGVATFAVDEDDSTSIRIGPEFGCTMMDGKLSFDSSILFDTVEALDQGMTGFGVEYRF
jgi:hypothetical protein